MAKGKQYNYIVIHGRSTQAKDKQPNLSKLKSCGQNTPLLKHSFLMGYEAALRTDQNSIVTLCVSNIDSI